MTIKDFSHRRPCRILNVPGYAAGEIAWFHPSQAARMATNGGVQLIPEEEAHRMMQEAEERAEENRQALIREAEENRRKRDRARGYPDKMMGDHDYDDRQTRPKRRRRHTVEED